MKTIITLLVGLFILTGCGITEKITSSKTTNKDKETIIIVHPTPTAVPTKEVVVPPIEPTVVCTTVPTACPTKVIKKKVIKKKVIKKKVIKKKIKIKKVKHKKCKK